MKTLLRPHHGLCIHFYEGKGYNEEFTKKMDALINQIQRNPRDGNSIAYSCGCIM